jgi:hypothetical protein
VYPDLVETEMCNYGEYTSTGGTIGNLPCQQIRMALLGTHFIRKSYKNSKLVIASVKRLNF